MDFEVIEVSQWIEENKADFKPPICNKCLFSDQLKAFLVGGPNIRKDFHLEEGEEVFYMLQGDMCLKTANRGAVRDIEIKEGQIYMQPGRILHSPQRKSNTVGLVVERTRAAQEMDSLRFFKNESTLDVAFERWFHLNDAVADLPPVIDEYLSFEKFCQNCPGQKSVDSNLNGCPRPFEANEKADLEKPLYIADWIKANAKALEKSGMVQLYGPPKFSTTVNVYGPARTYMIQSDDRETFIWFLEGNGSIIRNGKTYSWKAVECTLVPLWQSCHVMTKNNSYFFTVKMPTPAYE